MQTRVVSRLHSVSPGDHNRLCKQGKGPLGAELSMAVTSKASVVFHSEVYLICGRCAQAKRLAELFAACSIYTGRLCCPGTVLPFSSRNLFRKGILGLVGKRGG